MIMMYKKNDQHDHYDVDHHDNLDHNDVDGVVDKKMMAFTM